jgi:deoxyxylulose-5-phosphate synthase
MHSVLDIRPLSGGMAYEALNNAGHEKKDLLVILNDNNISIDPSVGAMKEYLLDITTSQAYNKVKNDIWNLLGALNKINPNTRQYFQKLENAIKSIECAGRHQKNTRPQAIARDHQKGKRISHG